MSDKRPRGIVRYYTVLRAFALYIHVLRQDGRLVLVLLATRNFNVCHLFIVAEKSMEFEAVKVKSLDEIHRDKLRKSSTVEEAATPTSTISTSFNLNSVIAETLSPLKYPRHASTSTPREDSRFRWLPPAPPTSAATHLPQAQGVPSIFPGAQHGGGGGTGASIFSARYQPRQAASVVAAPTSASVPSSPSVSVDASTSSSRRPSEVSVSVATESAVAPRGPSSEPSESPKTPVTSGVSDDTPSVRLVKKLSSHKVHVYMYSV